LSSLSKRYLQALGFMVCGGRGWILAAYGHRRKKQYKLKQR
jgi:hypothetical protein